MRRPRLSLRLSAALIPLVLGGCATSPIIQAARSGDVEKLRELAADRGGIDDCHRCPGGGPLATALACAAFSGQLEAARLLLDKGADIHKECFQAPIQFAAQNRHSAVVRLLIQRGARVDAPGWRSPLGHAVLNKDLETIRLLLDAGANPDVKLVIPGFTQPKAVEWARKKGHAETVRLLEAALSASPGDRVSRARAAVLSEAAPAIEAGEKEADAAAQAGRRQAALARYAEALKLCPPGSEPETRLRAKVFGLARSMNPPPMVPEEAQNRAKRAQAFLKHAENEEGFRKGVAEMEAAVALAPWWPDAYYNLGVLQEKSKAFGAAVRSLKLYLEAAPGAEDARSVRDRIVELEVKQELSGRAPQVSSPAEAPRPSK